MQRPISLALQVLTLLSFVACTDDAPERGYGATESALRIHATGSSVAKPLMAKWAAEYARVDPRVTIDYDPSGSGAAVKAVVDRSAEFGVSDVPLSDDEAKAHPDVIHVPIAVEAVALVHSVKGLAAPLQMTEDTVADVLQGRVPYWDDPTIASTNQGAKLPHTPIAVVFRSDESGASGMLSAWLARTSKHWLLGSTKSLQLRGTGVQRDDGILARMRAVDGAIGYVSIATVLAQKLPTIAVRNPSGRFAAATLEALHAAATAAALGDDLRADAIAAPGDLAYPIVSFAFVLVRPYSAYPNPVDTAVARFLRWAVRDGQRFVPPLGFASLPGEVALRDENAIASLTPNTSSR